MAYLKQIVTLDKAPFLWLTDLYFWGKVIGIIEFINLCVYSSLVGQGLLDPTL